MRNAAPPEVQPAFTREERGGEGRAGFAHPPKISPFNRRYASRSNIDVISVRSPLFPTEKNADRYVIAGASGKSF